MNNVPEWITQWDESERRIHEEIRAGRESIREDALQREQDRRAEHRRQAINVGMTAFGFVLAIIGLSLATNSAFTISPLLGCFALAGDFGLLCGVVFYALEL